MTFRIHGVPLLKRMQQQELERLITQERGHVVLPDGQNTEESYPLWGPVRLPEE